MTRRVDKHGLQMYGLRQVCSDLKDLRPWHSCYCQVFYDLRTGAVWTQYHTSRNNWTRYDDKDVLFVLNAFRPLPMQVIADNIYRVVTLRMEMINNAQATAP